MLYFYVLYCTFIHSFVLLCIVMYRIIFSLEFSFLLHITAYFNALRRNVFYHLVVYPIVLHCHVLCCHMLLSCIVSLYIAFDYYVLHFFVLYCIIRGLNCLDFNRTVRNIALVQMFAGFLLCPDFHVCSDFSHSNFWKPRVGNNENSSTTALLFTNGLLRHSLM